MSSDAHPGDGEGALIEPTLMAALAYDDWLDEMARRCPQCGAPMNAHLYPGGAEFTCCNSDCGYVEDLERDAPREELVRY